MSRWINFVDAPPLHPRRVGGQLETAIIAPEGASVIVHKEDERGLFKTLLTKIREWTEENKDRVNIISSVFGVEFDEEKRVFLRTHRITYVERTG